MLLNNLPSLSKCESESELILGKNSEQKYQTEIESELISGRNLEQKEEEYSNINDELKGLIPLSYIFCFLSRIWFWHCFIYLLELSRNVIKKKVIMTFKHLQFLTEEQRIEHDLTVFMEKYNSEIQKNKGNISEWSFMMILLTIFKKRLISAYFFWTFV